MQIFHTIIHNERILSNKKTRTIFKQGIQTMVKTMKTISMYIIATLMLLATIISANAWDSDYTSATKTQIGTWTWGDSANMNDGDNSTLSYSNDNTLNDNEGFSYTFSNNYTFSGFQINDWSDCTGSVTNHDITVQIGSNEAGFTTVYNDQFLDVTKSVDTTFTATDGDTMKIIWGNFTDSSRKWFCIDEIGLFGNNISAPSSVDINLTQPLNTYYNANTSANFTISLLADNLINCTININSNGSIETINENNINTTTNSSITYLRSIVGFNEETNRIFNATCTDGSNNDNDQTTNYFDDIAPRLTTSYNNTNTTENDVWINITFTDLNINSTYTQLEDKYNETNTSLSGNFSYYKWQNTTEWGIGQYTVNGWAYDKAGNNKTFTTFFNINPGNNYLTIRAYNYLGTTLLSASTIYENHTNTTYTGNTYQNIITDYINKTNTKQEIRINLTDTTYKHIDYSSLQNITRQNWEYNISMTASKLLLSFEQAGSPTNTEGFIADENKARNFSNSSLIVIQSDLAEGYVNIRFEQTSGVNHTQYYEYINDYVQIDETLEILQLADWYTYFQVLDQSSSPLRDVTIWAYISDPTASYPDWNNMSLFGRRLTDDAGYSFFWADTNSQAKFIFTKDGYNPATVLMTVGDESFTKAEAFQVYLEEGTSSAVQDNAWVYVQRDFSNRSLDLSGGITAVGYERVQVTTSYRESSGLEAYDLTIDALDRSSFTLRSGTDFSLTDSSNITLQIYLNNELWKTLNIEYDNSDKTSVFTSSNLTGQSDKIVNPIIAILIILLSVGIGQLTKNEDTGVKAFKVFGVLAGFISLNFWWLGTIIITEITLLGLRRIITE